MNTLDVCWTLTRRKELCNINYGMSAQTVILICSKLVVSERGWRIEGEISVGNWGVVGVGKANGKNTWTPWNP